jgi:hypothetical protein
MHDILVVLHQNHVFGYLEINGLSGYGTVFVGLPASSGPAGLRLLSSGD